MIKIALLGGADEIGSSMYYIEFNGEAVVIDAGDSFSGELSLLGVEKIKPSDIFIKQNLSKIKGIFLTHIHEDHCGQVMRLAKEYGIAVYGGRISLDYIKNKGEVKYDNLHEIDNNKIVKFYRIAMRPFSVEHSVLDSYGYEIKTPCGRIICSGDYKLGKDKSSVSSSIKKIGIKPDVFMFISESTNADKEGFSSSEEDIVENIRKRIKDTANGILIITSFASNMARLQNIIKICQNEKRKVYVFGRSMEYSVNFLIRNHLISSFNVRVLNDTGGIKYIKHHDVLLTTGSQGESNSGIFKIYNKFDKLKDKYVMFSSSIIPGNEKSIRQLKVLLIKSGFEIFDNSNLHASGHCCREEIKLFIDALKPKYFIPVHGDYIKLKANARNAEESNVNKDNIILGVNGSVICFKDNKFTLHNTENNTEYLSAKGELLDLDCINERKLIASRGIINFYIMKNKMYYNSVGISKKGQWQYQLYNFKKYINDKYDYVSYKILKKEIDVALKPKINDKMIFPYINILG